jgi:hypothetical protein
MKVEFTDDQVLMMAKAVKELRELEKDARPVAPTSVLCMYAHCDHGFHHDALSAFSDITDAYKSACLAAAENALTEIKARLRAIADGKDVRA